MNKTVLLTPPIYCGYIANLSGEVRKLQAVGINWIHFDEWMVILFQIMGWVQKNLMI